MRSVLVATMISAFSVFGVACKGDPQQCESACRNYATLTHWKKKDAEIAAAPPETRASMKKRAIAEFENKLEDGIDQCVAQCVSAHNEEQTNCMVDAKSAEAIQACVK
jgi:hypothetical protein